MTTIVLQDNKYTDSEIGIFEKRYLLKDNKGNIVETLDDLFKRVAVASGLMEVLYDDKFYDIKGSQPVNPIDLESFKRALIQITKINNNREYGVNASNDMWGEFPISHFNVEMILERYIELYEKGHMKLDVFDVLQMMQGEAIQKQYLPTIERYYKMMKDKQFLPNTPCLMNAGTKIAQNSACFTLPIHDSMESIIETQGNVMRIFKTGGGIGINYSELRPDGSFISTTGGVSPGPMNFITLMDAVTGSVKQGGKRRGAAMAELNINHPDIEKFIDSKKNNDSLENHNISVVADDKFFEDVMKNDKALRLLNKIAMNAWKSADPGMVFLENMNSNNLLKGVFGKPIEVTNPCSEISMYPYDSCNLASINLVECIDKETNKFQIFKFIHLCIEVTRFLDNIIDATKYPIPEIDSMTRKGRRIGVGYMGLGDALTILGIPYNSQEGFLFCEYITALMSMACLYSSNLLAEERGVFPFYKDEKYPKNELPVNALRDEWGSEQLRENINKIKDVFSGMNENTDLYANVQSLIDMIDMNQGFRNCSVTTVAPTGTLSMMVGTSSGIEPVFSHGFTKKVTVGNFEYVNENLIKALKNADIYTDDLVKKIVNEYAGSIQQIKDIPEYIRKVFVSSMDIHPFDHLMMQSRAQKWITNGISKTINCPNDISPELIRDIYYLAWRLGCKGTTIYRDGSKNVQVLNNKKSEKKPKMKDLKMSDYTRAYTNFQFPSDFVQYDSSHPEKVSFTMLHCKGCGNSDTYEIAGASSCFICRSCGHSVGSCS